MDACRFPLISVNSVSSVVILDSSVTTGAFGLFAALAGGDFLGAARAEAGRAQVDEAAGVGVAADAAGRFYLDLRAARGAHQLHVVLGRSGGGKRAVRALHKTEA